MPLLLPGEAGSGEGSAARGRRARRGARVEALQQLWLFAPFAQVPLPLADSVAGQLAEAPVAAAALSGSPAGGMKGAMTADDPRRLLLELLAAHASTDAAEAADVDRIARFVAANADCFGRGNPIAHITASAFVLDPEGRVLLTHHKKLDRWLQLGGHGDPDEHDPAATALREASEESGLADLRFHPAIGRRPLDVDAHGIPARKAEAAHEHLDIRYALFTEHPEGIALTDESHDLRWFAPAEILALDVDAGFRRALAKVVGLKALGVVGVSSGLGARGAVGR